ncbi:MAG: COG1361 S-layer family protein [Nanoarchaeota archaeon]
MKKTIISILVLVIFCAFSGIVLSETSSGKVITISLVNQDPDPAVAGDVVEIRLGVENKGGTAAENTILEFIPQYPFSAVAGEDTIKKAGTIKAQQYGADMKIIKLKLRVDRDASAGEYELKIKEYEEGKGDIVSVVRSINIEVQSKESAEVIYIDKTLLIPGKEETLKFTINNVGSAPLRDLTFNWVNADKIILPVGSDNTKYIRYIDIGESVDLQYKVIADTNVEAGLYELSIQLTYDDPLSGEEKEINTIAGIYVGGGTDFDIAFSESSSGQTSFTIANVGSNPASSVSVMIPNQQGWRVSGTNSMIIGNLNTGDYTVASFGLQSSQIASAFNQTIKDRGTIPRNISRNMQNSLKVQIAYTDTMGKREVVEKEIAMSPQNMMSTTANTDAATIPAGRGQFGRATQQQSFFSKFKWYFVILVILVAFGVSYRKYTKQKLIDPDITLKEFFKIKNILRKKKK